MTYLCTVRLPSRNLLVRVELERDTAHYLLLYGDGSSASYSEAVTGVDGAISDLIRDLLWSQIHDCIEVVQAGIVNQHDIGVIVDTVLPYYEVVARMTSESIQ